MKFPLNPNSRSVRDVLEHVAAQSDLVTTVDLQTAGAQGLCVFLDHASQLTKPSLFSAADGQKTQEEGKSENDTSHTWSFLHAER